jgi:hypothetical protein
MRVGLVIYGSIETLTGGYLYDRRLVDHLVSRGDRAEVISLPRRNHYPRALCDNARVLGPYLVLVFLFSYTLPVRLGSNTWRSTTNAAEKMLLRLLVCTHLACYPFARAHIADVNVEEQLAARLAASCARKV